MSVVHTSRLRIEKHEGPHRTALVEGFTEPIHFGIHGGIRDFYKDKGQPWLAVPGHPGPHHCRGRRLTDRHLPGRTEGAPDPLGQ